MSNYPSDPRLPYLFYPYGYIHQLMKLLRIGPSIALVFKVIGNLLLKRLCIQCFLILLANRLLFQTRSSKNLVRDMMTIAHIVRRPAMVLVFFLAAQLNLGYFCLSMLLVLSDSSPQ